MNQRELQHTRSIMSSFPGHLLYRDLTSKTILINDLHLKVLNLKLSDELLADGILDENLPVRTARCWEEFRAQDLDVLRAEKPITYIGNFCWKDDEWHVCIYTRAPRYDSSGKLAGIAVNGFDVTNLKISAPAKELGFYDMRNGVTSNKQFVFYNLSESFDGHNLSEKQSEVLFYALRGKSAKQIARIMGISFRTIEYYFNIIKRKLNCDSKSQVIEKAIQLGYINMIPKSLIK